MFKRVVKMARLFWEPDFVQGETLGAVAIVTTVLMVVESQVDPKSVVAPMLAVIALICVGLAIHYMELFKGKVKE